MEAPQSSVLPIPAPRKYHRLMDTPKCDMDHVTLRPLRFIPRNILDNIIIWLDLFSNERDLTFVCQMVAAKRLITFDTAVDCIDFLELSCLHRDVTPVESTFSIILSGAYVIDGKVIKKLLKHDCVRQIYLILNEFRYGNLSELHLSHRKIRIIYNNNPDAVMGRLCDNYSHFEAFTLYNNELYTSVNNSSNRLSVDIVAESKDPTAARVDDSNLKCGTWFSDLHRKADAECSGRVGSDIRSEDMSTNNDCSSARTVNDEASKVQPNKVNIKTANGGSPIRRLKSNDSTSISSQLDGTSARQDWKPKPMERSYLPPPRNCNDALALGKLEHIKENVALFNQRIDKFKKGDFRRDDHAYKELEEQALQMMIQCDELTDVSPNGKAKRKQVIHNIQQVMKKLDSMVLVNDQFYGNKYSIAV